VPPPTGNDRFSQAVAADHANQPVPYKQPASITNANWTPAQIAASQATVNSPQGQAYAQNQQAVANPWKAPANNPTVTRTQQQSKPLPQSPDKMIRDAKLKKEFEKIDANSAKRRQAMANTGSPAQRAAHAKVNQELAGKTPAQRRELYKKWYNKK
jgi:hypothetical protein